MVRSKITVLDGGTGRELQRMGAPFRQPEWSALALIEAPEYVSEVHRRFIAAGADIITTNSYAAVPFHIGDTRFQQDGEMLAARAGALARRAADKATRSIQVAGSLPPVCGSYRADLFDRRTAQPILETLVRGLLPYVDHWQAETLSCIAEAELVRTILGRDSKPLWLSFTLDDEATSAQLRSQQSVVDATLTAMDLNAEAILFNCSQPEVMGRAVDAARACLIKNNSVMDVGVYANAFPPQRADAEANTGLDPLRADLPPAGYLVWVKDWISRGATIIGGCCGIGPEHIAALSVYRDR